jgi:hypothetical protein
MSLIPHLLSSFFGAPAFLSALLLMYHSLMYHSPKHGAVARGRAASTSFTSAASTSCIPLLSLNLPPSPPLLMRGWRRAIHTYADEITPVPNNVSLRSQDPARASTTYCAPRLVFARLTNPRRGQEERSARHLQISKDAEHLLHALLCQAAATLRVP